MAFFAYFRQLFFLKSDGIRFGEIVPKLRSQLQDAELLRDLADIEMAYRTVFEAPVLAGPIRMKELTESGISRYLHSDRPNELSGLTPSD